MRILVSALLVGSLCGCATIFQPGPDKIPFRTEPEGASVYLNADYLGETPLRIRADRRDNAYIEIKKEGYEPIILDLHKVLAGWFPANILFPPGFALDLITRSQGKYSDNPIFIKLVQKSKN